MTTTGTLRLARQKRLVDGLAKWQIVLDGQIVGSIANGRTVDLPVETGTHTLRLAIRWQGSPTESFVAQAGEVVAFACRPRPYWLLVFPYLVLSVFRHDLWIVLERA